MENENLNEEQLEETASEEFREPEVPQTAEPAAEPAAPAQPQKQSKTGLIVLTVVLCLALLASLTVAILAGTGVLFRGETGTAAPDTTEQETTEPVNLKSYSVDAETAVANADRVIGTIGDVRLTNGELQTCYQMGVYNFLSANQYYLAYMGLDLSKPLDQQVFHGDTTISWQEYLLEQSLKSWHLYTVLSLLGQEACYELDEEGKAYLAEMEETLKTNAENGGYESVEAMLQVVIAPGATAEGYQNFMALNDYAYRYYNRCSEDLQPDAQQLEQYFTENQAALEESGISKDAGNLVDVRHILIKPEGGTTDGNNLTVYSDEEWEACRRKAQDILDQWKSGEATEESFGALAKEHTADGNGNVGGLYEKVYQGWAVEEFDNWIFDESRAYGDTDLVKTTYGYHIMFFVKSRPSWEVYTAQQYVTEKLQEMVNAAYERWPMVINYDAICLGVPEK